MQIKFNMHNLLELLRSQLFALRAIILRSKILSIRYLTSNIASRFCLIALTYASNNISQLFSPGISELLVVVAIVVYTVDIIKELLFIYFFPCFSFLSFAAISHI